MNQQDASNKEEAAQQVLGRLRVIKINDLDELNVLLSMILSQLRKKQVNFDLRMLVIDSLSSLFNVIPNK